MLRSKIALILCVLLVLFAPGFVAASDEVTAAHPTTPFQYWKDYCGYGLPAAYATGLAKMIEAEALLVPRGLMEVRSDNPNFYRFTATQPNVNWRDGIPMGGSVPFYGETQLATAGRSGFLVAPNIIATAAHVNFDPYAYYIVFDMREKPSAPGICSPPDPEHIPAAHVYTARPSAALIANTIVTYGSPMLNVDYAAFYLDRSVESTRRYLRMRRSGHLAPYDHFAMIGHPNRLPAKLLYDFPYAGDAANIVNPSIMFPLFNDFYLWEGMSGGPVYNLDRNVVEVAVGGPLGAGCTTVFAPNSVHNPYPYYAVSDACDDVPIQGELAFHQVNEGPISMLADLVPLPYLRVTPLDDVTYVLPINGTPSPAQTTYTATASTSETTTTNVSAYLVTPPAGQPAFVSIGSYASLLAPGTSTMIDVNASVPNGTACGVYDRYVDIADMTHYQYDRMRHRFEIGMTDFTVTPEDTQDIYYIVPPSDPAQIVFTLQNTKPTAVTVNMTLGQPWLIFDPMGERNQGSILLAPAGQPGSTKTRLVKINPAALPEGSELPYSVTFTGQGGCALRSPIVRTGTLHIGQLLKTQSIDALVYVPTPPAEPVTRTISVDSPFCLTDLEVRLNTEHSGIAMGLPLQTWVPSMRFYLDHVGNTSTSVQLWNHNAVPTGWTIPTYYDSSTGTHVETLIFNSTDHLPPTGQPLSAFNGVVAAGSWTFRIFDDGLQTINDQVLRDWELAFKGHACP